MATVVGDYDRELETFFIYIRLLRTVCRFDRGLDSIS